MCLYIVQDVDLKNLNLSTDSETNIQSLIEAKDSLNVCYITHGLRAHIKMI